MQKVKSIKIPMNPPRALRLAKFEKATGKGIAFLLERGLIDLEKSARKFK